MLNGKNNHTLNNIQLCFASMYLFSLISQGINGIGSRCANGLHAYGSKGDDQSQYCARDKWQDIQVCLIGKSREPVAHEIVGNWPGDEIGEQNEHYKFAGEQHDQMRCGGAQYFSHADFALAGDSACCGT